MVPDDDTRQITTVSSEQVIGQLAKLFTAPWPWPVDTLLPAAQVPGQTVQTAPDGEIVLTLDAWPLPGPYARFTVDDQHVRYVTFPLTAGSDLPTVSLLETVFNQHLAAALSELGEPDRYIDGEHKLARWHTATGAVTLHADTSGVSIVAACDTEQPAWDLAHGFDNHHTWPTFTKALAAQFGRGCQDDAIICSYGDGRFVQWIQNLDSVTIEVNDPDSAPLTGQQRTRLTADGWEAPSIGGGPSWTRDAGWRPDPTVFDDLAHTIVGVLRDVLGLPSPQQLTINAFNVNSGEKFELPVTDLEYQKAVADCLLRQSDLRLHEAATAFLLEREKLQTQTVAVVAMPADRRPTREYSGEFFVDRILLVEGDDPHILIWSHITPSGRSGSRLVPDHPPVPGPYIRAEQGNPVYIRDLLQRNAVVAAALRANPALHERLTALIATGRRNVIRAQYIQTSAEGPITISNMVLAPGKIDVPTLRLAPLTDEQTAP